MKNKKVLGFSGVLIAIVIGVVIYGFMSLKPVSKSPSEVTFSVQPNTSKIDIVKNLKKAGLIRSEIITLAYVFFQPNINLQAGDYTINKSSSTMDIINQIADGRIIDVVPTVRVTFVEGKRLVDYAELIGNYFDVTAEEFIEKTSDKEFLKELIDDYWFLDESILNEEIYYPLEGYLAPDTYEFYQNSSVEQIVRKLLSSLDKKLSPLKDDIQENGTSVHELLTIASIIEKEAINKNDRAKVSQVIYTRLEKKMSLGMDVTTYYGAKKDMKEYLTWAETREKNAYNTRNTDFIGLPVSSICNPSMESINAALNPSDTEYVYFVADVDTGEVFFFNTYDEFAEKKTELGL